MGRDEVADADVGVDADADDDDDEAAPQPSPPRTPLRAPATVVALPRKVIKRMIVECVCVCKRERKNSA